MCACICIHTSDCQAKHPSDEITHKCTWRTACHQLQLLVLRSSHYLLYHYYLCLQGFCSVYLLCSSPDCFPPPHLSDIIQPSFCSLLSPELLRLSPPSPHLLVSLVCISPASSLNTVLPSICLFTVSCIRISPSHLQLSISRITSSSGFPCCLCCEPCCNKCPIPIQRVALCIFF